MEFRKYQHVERWGTTEVSGIEEGECWVFPKLDGTNASVWWDEAEQKLAFGSRNRRLSADKDNHGFMHWFTSFESNKFNRSHLLFEEFPHWRLYGEWLVPHSLKTYREDAWRDFYVFDVWDDTVEEGAGHVPWETYSPELTKNGISQILPMCSIMNPTEENILRLVNNNTFLIEDGKGLGEGVVVKNYKWVNRHGRQTWAKMVRNEFKEDNAREMGIADLKGSKIVEYDLVEKFCTKALVDKVRAKMPNGENSVIPQFLQTVYYDLVREEIWEMVKGLKNPKVIDFSRLQRFTYAKAKTYWPELF